MFLTGVSLGSVQLSQMEHWEAVSHRGPTSSNDSMVVIEVAIASCQSRRLRGRGGEEEKGEGETADWAMEQEHEACSSSRVSWDPCCLLAHACSIP